MVIVCALLFFFFNDTATTEIYTLSLHDALPISGRVGDGRVPQAQRPRQQRRHPDRKSTRLNSSHANISYAVFCLKKNNHTTLSGSVLTLRPPSDSPVPGGRPL